MSNTVTLQDGGRTVVLSLTGLCEQGEAETKVAKIIAADLYPPARKLRIKKIDYNVSGGIVSLYRDTTDPVKIIDLAGDGNFDFSTTGGMPEATTDADGENDLDGSDNDTGNILFSTVGFDIGSSYAVRLELIKKI